jgi:hypothetical protein
MGDKSVFRWKTGLCPTPDDRIDDMQHWFNQHSFLVAAAIALFLLAALLLRDGLQPADLLALGALCLGLALAYALLRPGGSPRTQAQDVRRQIGQGRPVLLEFQSPT